WSLVSAAINVAAQPELRMGADVEAPVVDAIGKPGSLADPERIEFAVQAGRTERLIDVGIPSAFREGRWAAKGWTIVSHVVEQADRPDVVNAVRGGKRAGVLAAVVHVHG